MKTNLYKDVNGNPVKGKYIYNGKDGKYSAMCKYPEGYSKAKICYSMEEAIDFVENDYQTYALGWYYDTDMKMVFLRRRGDPRPERTY